MSSVMIDAGTPLTRLAATARSYRLASALAVGATVLLAVAFSHPSSGTSSEFIDLAVPQIVTLSGP